MEIVYTVSPDWASRVLLSLTSLYQSRTKFQRVRIIAIGSWPAEFTFTDSNIVVDVRPPKHPAYFFANKTYALETDSESMVFLDADTVVLRELDNVVEACDADFRARPATAWETGRNFDRLAWADACRKLNAPVGIYYNCGFVVFRGGKQKKLAELWDKLTLDLLTCSLADPENIHQKRSAEQIGLSLAVAAQRLSVAPMNKTHHSYGWNHEASGGSIVHHTGTQRFPFHGARACAERGFDLRQMDFLDLDGAAKEALFESWTRPPKKRGVLARLSAALKGQR